MSLEVHTGHPLIYSAGFQEHPNEPFFQMNGPAPAIGARDLIARAYLSANLFRSTSPSSAGSSRPRTISRQPACGWLQSSTLNKLQSRSPNICHATREAAAIINQPENIWRSDTVLQGG
jgi:hypothetical protein